MLTSANGCHRTPIRDLRPITDRPDKTRRFQYFADLKDGANSTSSIDILLWMNVQPTCKKCALEEASMFGYARDGWDGMGLCCIGGLVDWIFLLSSLLFIHA